MTIWSSKRGAGPGARRPPAEARDTYPDDSWMWWVVELQAK